MTGNAMAHPTTYALAPSVTLTVTAGEALLLNLTDETMFSLNDTGARIVELVAAGRTVADIVATLATEYRVSVQSLEPDVRALLESLGAAGLIVAADTGTRE